MGYDKAETQSDYFRRIQHYRDCKSSFYRVYRQLAEAALAMHNAYEADCAHMAKHDRDSEGWKLRAKLLAWEDREALAEFKRACASMSYSGEEWRRNG